MLIDKEAKTPAYEAFLALEGFRKQALRFFNMMSVTAEINQR
ncbi:hypothetical protein [Streptococcus sp. X13SY08]|nr:hypothetical protein [Streptococcus sp. X13SY08]